MRLAHTSPSITIQTQIYRSAKSPLNCKCKVCQHKWKVNWSDLQQGVGCPRCYKESVADRFRKWNIQKIRKLLRKSSPKVLIVSSVYKSIHLPLACKCYKCGHLWKQKWANLKKGYGCPKCAHRIKLTQHEVVSRLAKINQTIKIVGRFVHSGAKLRCQCKLCHYKWSPSWDSLRSGHGCPKCRSSYGTTEEQIRRAIQRITGWKFPNTIPSEVPWLHGSHLDGINWRHKIAFECQGPQHYRPISTFGGLNRYKRQKLVDARKRIQCWRYGIKLIAVPWYLRKEKLDAYLTKRLKRLI